jgi:hypothetical protein
MFCGETGRLTTGAPTGVQFVALICLDTDKYVKEGA